MKLSLKNISLKYSHKEVLKNLNIDFEEGKLHALLGENGAGKSTTANIICGELQPDSGTILLNDIPILLKTPKDAINHKICYVHQRPMVAESISVIENLKLGLCKSSIKEIPSFLSKFLPEINKNKIVKNCSADEKFFIAFISALLKHPDILILDEPTALLEKSQKEFLFEKLLEIKNNGINIIVITHDLDDAKKYFDTITCLKDGVVTDTENYLLKITRNKTEKKAKDSYNKTKFQLKFSELNCKPSLTRALKNINFICESGKITMIKGKNEDGLNVLEDFITGFYTEKKNGKLLISTENRNTTFNLGKNFSPREIRYKLGLKTGIVPTNRKYRGSNPQLTIQTIADNGTKHDSESPKQLISKAQINIKEQEKAANLSGGMLQRFIIAREFSENPDFLILCNPMQGLDSQTCETLKEQILSMKDNGCAVLILTTEDFPDELCEYNYQLKNGELL